LNMLNTKYIIFPDNNRQPVAFPNMNALGSAWFVYGVSLAENADAEIKAVNEFKPDSIAIVDKRFADDLKGFSSGKDLLDSIRLVSYAPNKLDYHYKTKSNGLAVFSEIYYPKGWNAYIDDKPVTHFRADYVLRAMVLPAGEHNLVFKFEPAVYLVGEKISLISSLILIVIVVFLTTFAITGLRKKQA